MNHFFTAFLLLALSAVFSFAGESFGGIGISILATGEGVRVVEVIPGSPAAEAGIETGDRITAVDGVALAGNDIEASKDALRGTVGKPLDLAIIREKESLSITLRRTQITIQDLDASAITAWYGKSQETYNGAELAVVAEQSAGQNMALLSVMQNGRVVSPEATVAPKLLSSVFIGSKKEVAPAVKSSVKSGRPVASLSAFNREKVSFNLREAGNVTIRIVNSRGEQIDLLSRENASAGDQSIAWKGDKAPSGHYLLYIARNGATSAFSADLR
jgi:membrane-associated protease RseP (regulator of RpoE activity)